MRKKISKRLSQKEFTDIYGKVPRLTVDVIVKSRSGIVFAKRDIEPWKGKWHIPGGTVRLNERMEEAAVRIMLEETGLLVTVGRLLGAIEYLYDKNHIHNHSVSVVFLASLRKGVLRGSPFGREVQFFRRMPKNIISVQKDFLKEHKFLE